MLFVPPSMSSMVPSAFAETYNVSNAPGSSTPGCENTNSCFIPNVLNIQVGDSVIWTNDDTTVHTITSGTSSGGTDGAFDSDLIQPGNSYSITFPNAYSYNYFCVVHPWMEGIVTVTSSTWRYHHHLWNNHESNRGKRCNDKDYRSEWKYC